MLAHGNVIKGGMGEDEKRGAGGGRNERKGVINSICIAQAFAGSCL